MSQGLKIIKDRAHMLAKIRAYFAKKNILEVDVPALSPFPTIDYHIKPLQVLNHYLHTSPEYGMKKLLAQGSGDIYQISHVFRAEEQGKYHSNEFTMIEWYQLNISYEKFIKEVLEFFYLFFGKKHTSYLSYKQAYEKYVSINPFETNINELITTLKKNNIQISENWEKTQLLKLILTHLIEPNLGRDELLVFYDFPAAEAALAKTHTKDNLPLAKRFEIYYQGIELANGYDELQDAKELKRRFTNINQHKEKPYPIDPDLIKAHEKGLPDCCGVAVGFDRAFMLRNKLSSISDTLPSAIFAQ